MTEQDRPERRRELRVSPKGTVVLRADSYELRGRVQNVSRHGLSIETRTTAPERLLGATVQVQVRLDGAASSWLELVGRVTRIEACSLAVVLTAVPASFTRIIDEITSQSHRHDRLLSIVLVDGVTTRRDSMAEGFRAVGCVVMTVSTPLEAIVRLGESDFEPDIIAIADSLPASIANELRRFVDLEHPDAWLVTIGDTASAPEGLENWLSSADPRSDLQARIRAMLVAFGRS